MNLRIANVNAADDVKSFGILVLRASHYRLSMAGNLLVPAAEVLGAAGQGAGQGAGQAE